MVSSRRLEAQDKLGETPIRVVMKRTDHPYTAMLGPPRVLQGCKNTTDLITAQHSHTIAPGPVAQGPIVHEYVVTLSLIHI